MATVLNDVCNTPLHCDVDTMVLDSSNAQHSERISLDSDSRFFRFPLSMPKSTIGNPDILNRDSPGLFRSIVGEDGPRDLAIISTKPTRIELFVEIYLPKAGEFRQDRVEAPWPILIQSSQSVLAGHCG